MTELHFNMPYYRHTIINEDGSHRPVTTPISMSETLTLRDQFAIAALPALIQKKFISPEKIAPTAYEFADAMLEARKEKK